METATLRALANAVDAIVEAKNVTGDGFVADHCDNALHQIARAMRGAIGDDGWLPMAPYEVADAP